MSVAAKGLFSRKWAWGAELVRALSQSHTRFASLLHKHVPNDGVIIDAVAHTGHFTKLFSQVVPQGHVYAFEPMRHPRSIISKVITLKKLRNVSLFPIGLSDVTMKKVLHSGAQISGPRGSTGGCPVIHGGKSGDETVNFTTLDQFAFQRSLKRIDLLKVGIEGLEMNFLLGAHHVIERFRPAIFVEVHDDLLHREGHTAEEVWSFLKALHYKVWKVENDGATLTPLSGPLSDGAIWCVADDK